MSFEMRENLKKVRFQNRFFKRNPDGCFRWAGADRQPAYIMNMGDQSVSVPLSSLRREIAGDNCEADDEMLDAVVESLKYVAELRLGDALPAEVVSGDASWTPEDRHRALAHKRVIATVVRWYEGGEMPLAEPYDLRRFLSAHIDREKITEALKRLDCAVGGSGDGLTRIHPIIKTLADDLAYVEALREDVERVRRIGEILHFIRHANRGQPSVALEINPVLRLHSQAMRVFDGKLAAVDFQLSDINATVSTFQMSRNSLRRIRNDLHAELVAWKGPLAEWARITPANLQVSDVLARIDNLYRFLAPRYTPVKDWSRADSAHAPAN